MIATKTRAIEKAVAEGMSIDEVCEMLDIQIEGKLNTFCRNNLGMSYRKLLKQKKQNEE